MQRLILLAFIVVLSATTPATSQTSAQKLAVRLGVEEPTVSLRGEVSMELSRVNEGSSPLAICREWGWGAGRANVRVFDANGKEVVTDFLADEMPPPPQPLDFVVLDSKDFLGTRINEPVTHFVRAPGDYTLVVEYTSYLSEEMARKMMRLPKNTPFWSRERGLITSNRLLLHVTE